jgi:peptidoglycan/xylan/chitin deacetylase (PgdA/CDA1 family)
MNTMPQFRIPNSSFLTLCRAFGMASLLAATAGAAPLRVALTFDDSLKDHLLIAAPMLEERGWRGTFCIVTDWVGKDSNHLTWDDVRELVRRGHEIATHTKSHQNLITLLEKGREDEVRRELLESADRILAETGFAPRFMFSPYVCQNETTDQICRELGLRQANVRRINFGSNNCARAAATVAELRGAGEERIDFLTHGVSAADHGGWCPFPNRESFRRHLDTLAELERQGEIIVTDYDGMTSNCRLLAPVWPRHGVLSLSFDDASFDQWEAAFPLFAKYDAHTTFFVIGTNRIDFMKKALAAGHEIGMHGLNHRDATPTVEEKGEDWFWEADIAPQLAALNEAGIPVRAYAYPNCCRTDRTDALFFSRGFARVRGTGSAFPPNPNPHDPRGEKLDKWRPVVTADWLFYPAVDFLNARLVPNVIMGENYHTDIEDIMRAISRAGECGEALFIVSHGISPNAKGISMKTEWLERMLSSANELGVLVRGIR